MFCYHDSVQRDQFHYHLPSELIAVEPPKNRRDARLLTLDGGTGALADRYITDIVSLVEAGDLLVFNDTRVIPARLFATKQTGGRVELLIERVLNTCEVIAQIRSSKILRVDSVLKIGGAYPFKVVAQEDGFFRLVNLSDTAISEIMDNVGHVPLPPYIKRADTRDDAERYQTVYSRVPGAVAAPTAGLHFDQELMQALTKAQADIGFLTLHVGAGTFQPVRASRLEDHRMHAEVFEISAELCHQVEQVRDRSKRVIAIGTTTVRALESAYVDGRLQPRDGETDIFIYPGYRFGIVDAMVTNFHLPESTLLMLISAFAGRDNIMQAYRHAIRERYRFFSYGDAMWITRGGEE